ncbi:MAG: VWA domain-containing protein [Acidobacteria bacterium]|nr:VWA domain-containing protein [Acidobacteriota bacterium]
MGRIAVVALAFWLTPLRAQQERPPVFRADVRLVRLLATVKDIYTGHLTGGLNKEDFTIYDNDVRQQAAIFERTTEQPLSIALLLDTSGSIAKDLKIAVDSVKRFLSALFREGNPADEVALYTFNWEVQQHTAFTRNFQQIEKRIQPLKAEAGTSLYDAIHYSSRALEKRNGRHVILIVTDGGDTTSYYKYHDALEAAHRADAPIYSILLMPITNDAGRNIGGENALTTLGQSTGGRVFTPSAGPELDQALAEILRDLRTQYFLAYYPRNLPRTDKRFHTIRIEIARADLRAITRSGYYEDATPHQPELK